MLQSPSITPEAAPPVVTKITRGHSCILCQQRKVKCDRQKPCSNCIKARAECIPSAPTVPRRRRRKFSEQDLATRLRKYEQLLKKHGVKIDDDDHSDENQESPNRVEHAALSIDAPRDPTVERGMLFKDKENTRYVESTLWENLRDEIQDPKDALQGSSDDEINEIGLYPEPERFLLGHGMASKDLKSLHPQPVHIFRLWQTFITNVNPLVKLFHAPTVQQTILDASGDLGSISRPVEALMFSIYLLAVTSLEAGECESMFGEPRNTLLTRFSHGAQQALINAKFMKSLNLTTLQALGLYLLAVRKYYDPHSYWILTGSALRIAQRLGIHRDGHADQISPFDSEIRRRTWWNILFIDGQASKLAGAASRFPEWLAKFDTQLPLNVSDSDLSPNMKELPKEKEGVTEMLFCCLRYEVARALRKSGGFPFDLKDGPLSATSIEAIAKKDKAISELEQLFHEKYIRFCDPSIPLHLLAIYVSKSVICTMKLMAHHPRQYPDKGASMPQKEKDMIFGESLKELEISSMGHSTPSVQGFLWHIHVHFQLDAFIYVISELRHRTSGEQVDRAWKEIELSFEQRPEMLNDTKNSLYFAIGNLTLKAWTKREEAGGLYHGDQLVAAPRFISVLRSQRRIPDPIPPPPATEFRQIDTYPKSDHLNVASNIAPSNDMYQSAQGWSNVDFSMDMNMPDIAAIDWEYYQTLLDGDLPAYAGPNPGTPNGWIV